MTDTVFDDPFGTPSAPASLPPAVASAPPAPKATTAPIPEAAFSFTLKSPKGNLFSIRGASAAQFAMHLQEAEGLIKAVVALEGAAAPAPVPQAPRMLAAYSQPPAQAAPADPNAPVCVHGPRVHKSGISKKTGNPYSLWACTMPQGAGQCPAIFG